MPSRADANARHDDGETCFNKSVKAKAPGKVFVRRDAAFKYLLLALKNVCSFGTTMIDDVCA